MIIRLTQDMKFLWNEGIEYSFGENDLMISGKKLFSGTPLFELDDLVQYRSGGLKKFLPELQVGTRYSLRFDTEADGLELSVGVEFYDDKEHKIMQIYASDELADFIVPAYAHYSIKFLAHILDQGKNDDRLKHVKLNKIQIDQIETVDDQATEALVVKSPVLAKNLQMLIKAGKLDRRLTVLSFEDLLRRRTAMSGYSVVHVTNDVNNQLKKAAITVEIAKLNILNVSSKPELLLGELHEYFEIDGLSEKGEIAEFLDKYNFRIYSKFSN
ncbi:hypothetical protein ESZ50_11490 [Weissella muntiaci]|uniref:Accessory Sec system protein Asp3 n=1 Tax=Weissella muntiaci TaxID=2508881 RepID=A0A6C2C246_9LACO|nr:accessory Sec system protein Asp3 [Weissella muntiaci]TYC47749.1 hypothetical protein ESZ50_11490 [Weissella muntiaci]